MAETSKMFSPESLVYVRKITPEDIPEVMRIQASALDVSYPRDWYTKTLHPH
jgi:hypothetical protein